MGDSKAASGLFAGPLADCSSRPNCVCTQASRARHQVDALRFEGSPSETIARVCNAVEAMERVHRVELLGNYVRFTFTTQLMRFVDDVEFWADADSGLLHFRSASRIGYSDFGANAKRMQAVCESLLATGVFRSS